MSHYIENSPLSINREVEQKPFIDPAVQSFFIKWCEINDAITPHFVNRKESEEMNGPVLRSRGKHQNLYISEDLRLWQMAKLIGEIDRDSFTSNPNRQGMVMEQIHSLGNIFQLSAIYIAQRLDSIEAGREVAAQLAEEFYNFGQSLVSGRKMGKSYDVESLSRLPIDQSEEDYIDWWLAGETLYLARYNKIQKKLIANTPSRESVIEKERRKALSQFFQIVAQLDRSSSFVRNVRGQLKNAIEYPKKELYNSIYNRGVEHVLRSININHSLEDNGESRMKSLSKEEFPLYEALQPNQMKAELEHVRQTGNKDQINRIEQEIVNIIHNAVGSYPFQIDHYSLIQMRRTQQFNCVGSSILGSALLEDVGITHLVVTLPGHSVLFVIFSDDHIEWRDMSSSNASGAITLTDIMIRSMYEKRPVRVEDIVAFSRQSSSDGLTFVIDNHYRTMRAWEALQDESQITVFSPKVGQEIQVLEWVISGFRDVKSYAEEVEACNYAISINPNNASMYDSLGVGLKALKRYEDAIEAYKQSIALDPFHSESYHHLGNLFWSLGKNQEAVEFYEKGIALNPNDAYTFGRYGMLLETMGRTEEAIMAFRKVLALDPPDTSLLFSVGEKLFELQSYESAIQAFEQSIDKNNAAAAYLQVGRAYYMLGKKEESLKALQIGISYDPKAATIYLVLGATLYEFGRNEEALNALQQCVKLSDSDSSGRLKQEAINLINMLKQSK